MKKTSIFILFLLSTSIFLNQNLLSQTTLLNGSWTVVDVQGLDNTELLEFELENLGNTWHFVSDKALVIENYSGIYSIPFQQIGSELSYLGRTVFIQKLEVHQIDLVDRSDDRKVLLSFRQGQALTEDKKAAINNIDPTLNLSQTGFDFSFEEVKVQLKEEQGVPEEKIYKEVSNMPRFPGCEDEVNVADRKRCADRKLLYFIYDNLKYPPLAREHGVEGIPVITFIVETDGRISNTKIVRDVGSGCGQEALYVVNLMKQKDIRWIPGVNEEGEPVRVQFNLPIKFKLQ